MRTARFGILPNRFLRNVLKRAFVFLLLSSAAYVFVYVVMGRQNIASKIPLNNAQGNDKLVINKSSVLLKPEGGNDLPRAKGPPNKPHRVIMHPAAHQNAAGAAANNRPSFPKLRNLTRLADSDAAKKRSKNSHQFLRLINAAPPNDADAAYDRPASVAARPGDGDFGASDDDKSPNASAAAAAATFDGVDGAPANILGRRRKFLNVGGGDGSADGDLNNLVNLNLHPNLINFNPLNDSLAADEQRRRLRADFLNKSDDTLTEYGGQRLPLCDEPSPLLVGKLKQATLLMVSLRESEVLAAHPDLRPGGSWRPSHCRPRYKVAVIVPFRDRQSHLTRLIDYLVPVLKRQLLDFSFIVTEQYGRDLFNKGRIMNAAFRFASDHLHVDCVVFHDVDMFPQDDRNFYGCPDEPRHIGAFVNTLGYELWYNYIVGGVLAIQAEQYIQINGYSNMFWAWGGEDDDMGLRILANNFTIERPDPVSGRMTMIKHVKRQKLAPSLVGNLIKSSGTRWVKDGLNETSWTLRAILVKPLYYHLYVDVGVPPDAWRNDKAKQKK